ncbi:MAG TPA: threonine aldolase family protein [Tepidisphaeraceae bacterium]|mgnify:CR=1 FL=1|nr:threonine aldolase family protein [Tepidisphaeraceae bacterium]
MINLFSDTQTKPTPEMRAAMAAADVGDEQLAEDPTVNRLQDMTAQLLGKEAAIFLPSGAMCNLVGVKTHTQPGDMILADRRCHIMRAECGGAAIFSGVMLDPLDGERGIFTPEQVRAAIPPVKTVYHPHPTLLCIENTHNYGGGSVWPIEQLRDVCTTARERGLAIHMDGARLFNASAASGVTASEYASHVDSVWIDLSKGLGCPVGAVIAGTSDFIGRARRWKHAFGGAMRQAGIIAAAGVYALQHNINRLKDDHANARLLAEGLSQSPRVRLLYPADTNIVFFNVSGFTPAAFCERAAAQGVRFSAVGGGIRGVTHLDVSREESAAAVESVMKALSE